MKVAVVALYFRPDQAIGSIRPENWARWIGESEQVSVVTKQDERAEDDGLPWKTVRHSGAMMRLLDRLNAWRKQRRLVRQAAIGEGSVVQGNTSGKAPSGVLTYRMPCLHDVWLLSSLRGLWGVKPDLVVATHSPYVTLFSAWLYVVTHPRVKLWVDFRDLWAGNHLAIGVPGLRIFERWLERKILHRAIIITTVSEGLADYFRGQGFSDKVHVVYNAPLALDVSPSSRERDESKPLTLCYTGTIYSGWRDPSPLFAQFRRLADEGVEASHRSIFQMASRNAGNLFELIEHFDVADQVDFLGELSRTEAMCLQQEADVLVMLESGSPEARGVLTGKLFEYLATDKPILLIGPGPDSELYQLIERYDRLLTLSELEAVVRGERALKVCQPVNYAAISRNKVREVLCQVKAGQIA